MRELRTGGTHQDKQKVRPPMSSTHGPGLLSRPPGGSGPLGPADEPGAVAVTVLPSARAGPQLLVDSPSPLYSCTQFSQAQSGGCTGTKHANLFDLANVRFSMAPWRIQTVEPTQVASGRSARCQRTLRVRSPQHLAMVMAEAMQLIDGYEMFTITDCPLLSPSIQEPPAYNEPTVEADARQNTEQAAITPKQK